jgi:hypothetical protein
VRGKIAAATGPPARHLLREPGPGSTRSSPPATPSRGAPRTVPGRPAGAQASERRSEGLSPRPAGWRPPRRARHGASQAPQDRLLSGASSPSADWATTQRSAFTGARVRLSGRPPPPRPPFQLRRPETSWDKALFRLFFGQQNGEDRNALNPWHLRPRPSPRSPYPMLGSNDRATTDGPRTYRALSMNCKRLKPKSLDGAPWGTRTSNLLIRSKVLYRIPH